MSALEKYVSEHETFGCRRVDRSLGFCKMPPGFALMLDADEIYFYWLRDDGRHSEVHWSKWAVRKGAMTVHIKSDAGGEK